MRTWRRIWKLLGIAGVAIFGLLVVGGVLFFHWMSLGQLQTIPPGGTVTVALFNAPGVRAVMADICHDFVPLEAIAPRRKEDYEKLTEFGILVRVPHGTPVLLMERGDTLMGTQSSFSFMGGHWSGRTGWACPSEVIALHAYP